MPVQQLAAALMSISTGLLALGGGMTVLTLAGGGIAMYTSWLDVHVAGFVKKLFMSVLGGSALLGMSGVLGIWLASQFGM
jgi:hypothetical protein